jgi:hypothetical protein
MLRIADLTIAFASQAFCAGPKITLVVGDQAPALEKRAAAQLSADLRALFDAEPSIVTALPSGEDQVLLIGSPKTNAAIPANEFPSVSDQGQVLKSTRSGLIVGGGSPVATLWAASELSYHFGVRHLLHGDAMPIEKRTLKLDGINVVIEPLVKVRAWDAFSDQAQSALSWPLEDHARLIPQLARLKFTHLILPAKLAGFTAITVDGDTAGRAAFKGAKSFAPPQDADLLDKLTKLAAEHGLEVVHEAPPGTTVIALGATKPSVLPQFAPMRLELEYQSKLRLPRTITLESTKTGPGDPGAKLIIQGDLVSAVAPRGFTVRAVMTGDLNAAAHYVSRASFTADLTAEQALAELVTPICGEGVAERLWKGFQQVEQAAKLIEANDPDLGVPGPQMFLRHLDPKVPVPAWLTEVKTLYTSAMSEMYRANTRARGGARPFILYHAKRMEFAMHCCTSFESLHKPAEEAAEAAPEAVYNALNAYADVARDTSDRAVIALLNVYGYHPVLKTLSK